MKNWLIVFCLLWGSQQGTFAMNTPPEKVLPLTQEIRVLSFYEEQAVAWKTTLNRNPKEPAAWLNLYTAARNLRTLSGKQAYDLQQIVDDAQQHIAGTFEYYYMAYWHSPISNRRFDFLLKAHSLDPSRAEAFHDLLIYYELQGDTEQMRNYCEKMFETNVIASGILNWNYNALMSVEEESILLVQGDNDTYPAVMLQQVHKIRPKVRILNIYLLQFFKDYRNRIFNELNIPLLETEQGTNDDDKSFQVQLIQHLTKYAKMPVYLGIALSEDFRETFESDLYLTGLAFLHFDNEIDNIAILKNNFEDRFRKDDLHQPLTYQKSQSVVNHINLNYIPLLVLLHNHYLTGKEIEKAERVKALGLDIAKRANQLSTIQNYFEPPAKQQAFESLIDFKFIEKSMQPLPGNHFASAYETTNAQYEEFLMDLLQQKRFDLLEKCKIHPTDWMSFIPEPYQGQSDEVYFENGHPEADEMPIVNITLEAAKLYCEWLTNAYNQSTHKRKKFGKVRFYIPTEAEWMEAARTNREYTFPWGGPYINNIKQCYLANFNPYKPKKKFAETTPEKESPGADGAFFPAVVSAYFPNDFGLYNISGNVAEMVQEGITKGGSWLEAAEFMSIDSQDDQPIPSPAVGFRIFMEILK